MILVKEIQSKTRKAETVHLWVNTATVVVSALIPVVWDIIRGIAN